MPSPLTLTPAAAALMGTQQRFAVPDGWVAGGFRFDLQPITAEQPGPIAQSFDGRRFAYSWAWGQVKADLDARAADPAVPLLAWDFYELRRAWNQAKGRVAPWWRRLGTGRTPRRGAVPAGQWGSSASKPAATVAGSASPPAQCVLSPTGATSSCR
jgi:hypothetical protein